VTISVGEKRTLTIPELEATDAPVAAATPGEATAPHEARTSTTDEEARSLKGRRTAGWVLGGLGLVSLGVGGYFGLQTLAKEDASKDLCPTDDTCSDLGVEYNEQAHTNAWISNIGIGVGVVGVALGTYFILTSSSAEPKTGLAPRPGWELTAFATPHGGEVRARGRW
jgi:hypothetical protein